MWALSSCRFFVTMLMAFVTATLFLRTNLHPDSVESGNLYFSVIFFSLISLMFDGFAEETLTVRTRPQPASLSFFQWISGYSTLPHGHVMLGNHSWRRQCVSWLLPDASSEDDFQRTTIVYGPASQTGQCMRFHGRQSNSNHQVWNVHSITIFCKTTCLRCACLVAGSAIGGLVQAAGQQDVPSLGLHPPHHHPAHPLQHPGRHPLVLHRLLPCGTRP